MKRKTHPPFRPVVHQFSEKKSRTGIKEDNQNLVALMKMCLEEEPEQRPTFLEIISFLKKSTKEK